MKFELEAWQLSGQLKCTRRTPRKPQEIANGFARAGVRPVLECPQVLHCGPRLECCSGVKCGLLLQWLLRKWCSLNIQAWVEKNPTNWLFFSFWTFCITSFLVLQCISYFLCWIEVILWAFVLILQWLLRSRKLWNLFLGVLRRFCS